MRFKNRQNAGAALSLALAGYRGRDTLVYALPRGGVAVGAEVARALRAPLDLVIPRKIGHPEDPEYAVAAVTETGEVVRGPERTAFDPEWFEQAVAGERAEARRRRERYLGTRRPLSAAGKICVVVDDGLATGLTMRAALAEIRRRHPARVVVAVPVAPAETVTALAPLAEDVVVLYAPAAGFGTGAPGRAPRW
jgi:predicted phosphoribosyltransferase